ncbi:MAG: glycogen/starch/alpha-glucan phosphorylase [Natronospirillum sp.]|uniref:glycogen/starch/alpha-glucan phosphorylase n=1 Tax=Natronospirillum sp. TaxID=2812955 RepID=UPI0025EF9E9D|nr:glycogen/starch/alpha-glucan phosphorylase [Natronospirillum sp.]MCH8552427.1 glycogen/starch/alpha-glucan phosphorylase [Natronospirillum sp.]
MTTQTRTKTRSASSRRAPATAKTLQQKILHHLHTTQGTYPEKATPQAWWEATAAAVNEFVMAGLTDTQKTHSRYDTRAVNYLSMEFLMGRLLSNNLHNLHLFEAADTALKALGQNLPDLLEEEPDMALGNGGLGRLAACFLDSLASLNYPAVGYGIHYEHGLFEQHFRNGHQIERPDDWREYGNPWEVCRPESAQQIKLYGYVETVYEEGKARKVWHPGRTIKAVPWDIPIVGYNGANVNILRLWESRATDFFDWDVFNAGGYVDAQAEQAEAEAISKVLYPNDETDAGKELRLIQQYFFSAASLADIVRRYQRAHGDDWTQFPKLVSIQLNDTHPAVAIPELMRLLIDDKELDWQHAWQMCRQVFSYTNHTLLPEALEKWDLRLFEHVLPRHLELIYEINHQFLNEEVERKWPGDDAVKARLSIIEEGRQRMVRMGHLSVIGSHTVNGVAEVHSKLVKSDLFPEFDALWPDKLTNVTNGITPRRWLKACNPGLSDLIDKHISKDWPVHLSKLSKLKGLADDVRFQNAFMKIKHENKEALADEIKALTGVEVSPDAIFDIQIKRLHEYKRQHLNLLHILALYRRLLENPDYDMVPRVFIFGAKAAPGYRLAKDIIFAINKVAARINHDERIGDKIKVVMLPNYRVSLAEKMIPAADVSEQISTAGKEASGTGNMKLALNGALTIGTLDGANIEIAEEAGEENEFIFGLTVDEVKALDRAGYNPYDYYLNDPEIKAVVDWLDTDYFTPGQPRALSSIKHSLLDGGDPFKVLADFRSYAEAQLKVDAKYRDRKAWARSAIINTATMGKFNSDRSIQDYVDRVWQLQPYPRDNA